VGIARFGSASHSVAQRYHAEIRRQPGVPLRNLAAPPDVRLVWQVGTRILPTDAHLAVKWFEAQAGRLRNLLHARVKRTHDYGAIWSSATRRPDVRRHPGVSRGDRPGSRHKSDSIASAELIGTSKQRNRGANLSVDPDRGEQAHQSIRRQLEIQHIRDGRVRGFRYPTLSRHITRKDGAPDHGSREILQGGLPQCLNFGARRLEDSGFAGRFHQPLEQHRWCAASAGQAAEVELHFGLEHAKFRLMLFERLHKHAVQLLRLDTWRTCDQR
jgi:hypothetical protein